MTMLAIIPSLLPLWLSPHPGDPTADLLKFLRHYKSGRIDAAKVQKLFKTLEPDPVFPGLERALARASTKPDVNGLRAILEVAVVSFGKSPEEELKFHATRQPWVVRRRAIDELREYFTSPALQSEVIELLHEGSLTIEKRRVLIELLGAAHERDPHEPSRLTLQRALASPDASVRALAAEGFGPSATKRDLPALTRLLFDTNANVRLRVTRALGAALQRLQEDLQEPERVRYLTLFGSRLSDPDPHVRYLAAEALKSISHKCLWNLLVSALEAEEARHESAAARLRFRVAIEDLLHQIAGVGEPVKSAAEWKDWKARRDHAAGASSPISEDHVRTVSSGKRTIKRKYATYFGREVKSDHVVFIMDFSGSMRRKTGTRKHDRGDGGRLNTPRIVLAKTQFARYLKALDETHQFNVVVFAVGSRAAFKGLVPATRENKAKAQAFLGGLILGGSTDLFSGVLTGLQAAGLDTTVRLGTKADTVYLLSDGIPTAGPVTHPADIVRILSKLNRASGLTINVVDLGARHSAFQKHLRALALQNGGEYIRP